MVEAADFAFVPEVSRVLSGTANLVGHIHFAEEIFVPLPVITLGSGGQ